MSLLHRIPLRIVFRYARGFANHRAAGGESNEQALSAQAGGAAVSDLTKRASPRTGLTCTDR